MDYIETTLKKEVEVNSVISVHYYEYPIDFAFSGEIHNFWELVYTDKGEAVITAGSQELLLPQGHLFLHRPMEYHNIRCSESGTVNSFIISFTCDCPNLYSLAGRVLTCTPHLQELMANIVTEANEAFDDPLDRVILPQLRRRPQAAFGSEQLVQLYLEQMLVLLLRSGKTASCQKPPLPTVNQRRGDVLLQNVCAFLEAHVADNISMDTLCHHFSVSKSTLQKLFQHRMGQGVSRYYQHLRVTAAKRMIREKQYNFTEIAQALGYSSVHYFSRHFKQLAGMTPSEYAASIKAKMHE